MQKEIDWLLKEKYDNKPTEQFKKDVERLKAGEPLAYVIGFVEFLGCKIDLSKKPLIPRPETEFWVEEAIKQLPKKKPLIVLDIFSGSGCIGIAIASSRRSLGGGGCDVVFAEKDKNLVGQIKINAKLNKLKPSQYKVIQSDIFKNVKGKFDVIFANPPYITTKRKHKIQKSVLRHEPKIALFGGGDGLFYIKKFLAQASNFLNPDSTIFMEFDYIQKRQIEVLLKKYGYKSWEFKKDQYGRQRFVIIHF